MIVKVKWEIIEDLIKRIYGLKSVQLMTRETIGEKRAFEIIEYPEWVEGEKV